MTSNEGRGGRRYLPYVFTEQGVAMLSSVLRSDGGAGQDRHHAYVRRPTGPAVVGRRVARNILDREQKYDAQFGIVFDAIRQLSEAPPAPERRMGFRTGSTQEVA